MPDPRPGLTEPLPRDRAEAVREALGRIAGSEAFRNAPQLVAFLRFVVERSLAGRAGELKGYTIATEALGRDPDFDPQIDPIIRVEAGRLRRALEAYYAGPGVEDSVRIAVPRGAYVPCFDFPEPPAPVLAPEPGRDEPAVDENVSAVDEAPRAPPAAGGLRRRLVRAVAPLALAVAGIALVGALSWDEGRPPSSSRTARPPEARRAVTSRPKGLATIVVAPVETVGAPGERFSGVVLRDLVVGGLARFDELDVIDRPERGEAAGSVLYVLALRVAVTQASISVAARLTHRPSGTVVWSREFDPARRADPDAPPELDLARQISVTLGQPYGVVFADLHHRPGAPSRTRCLVRAYDYWRNPSRELHAQARDCLEAEMAADGAVAALPANLAFLYLDEHRVGYNPRPDPLDRALRAARRAVEAAPESPRAHQALMAAHFVRGEVDTAMRHGARAAELNPYDSDILADLGARTIQLGRYREGEALIRRAAAVNPAEPPWYDFFLFVAALMQDDAGRAVEAAQRIDAPDYALGLVARAIAADLTGDRARAGEALRRLVAVQPDFARDPSAALARRRFAAAVQERLTLGLRRAGLETAAAGP